MALSAAPPASLLLLMLQTHFRFSITRCTVKCSFTPVALLLSALAVRRYCSALAIATALCTLLCVQSWIHQHNGILIVQHSGALPLLRLLPRLGTHLCSCLYVHILPHFFSRLTIGDWTFYGLSRLAAHFEKGRGRERERAWARRRGVRKSMSNVSSVYSLFCLQPLCRCF